MNENEIEEIEVEELEASEQPLYRIATATEVIFRDDDVPTIEGKLVPYGEWSEVNSLVEGHFMERFAAGSLTKTFQEGLGRIKGYFEHGMSRMFDRMPVMDIKAAWDTDEGGFFRAEILDSVPELVKDGLRRGIYGASFGGKPIKGTRVRRPGASEHNPQGLEERTYTEVRGNDISLTPRPHYSYPLALRSIADDLLIERLLEDPTRLRDLIVARTEIEVVTPEPQHSPPPEQEAPAPEGSRSTQPVRDYLSDEEGAPSWAL